MQLLILTAQFTSNQGCRSPEWRDSAHAEPVLECRLAALRTALLQLSAVGVAPNIQRNPDLLLIDNNNSPPCWLYLSLKDLDTSKPSYTINASGN